MFTVIAPYRKKERRRGDESGDAGDGGPWIAGAVDVPQRSGVRGPECRTRQSPRLAELGAGDAGAATHGRSDTTNLPAGTARE